MLIGDLVGDPGPKATVKRKGSGYVTVALTVCPSLGLPGCVHHPPYLPSNSVRLLSLTTFYR